ncbi:biliverdin-producing heme oxygenase [Noviherbaspirillum aridicola]|uniref:biliverdin-producing heme oxygenase n=1 Tax=Noviherbaspirillum aridicola TaxID=2849687 RepID=UPI001C7FD9DE|nr:biliverdin-producing heme oxygenase [Noviherbaspirillum aridicola]
MRETATALSELRSATRALHEQLEASLPVADANAGREEFLHYLQDMWGWLSGFEAQLWQAEWPSGMNAAARDGKLAWIETDLRAAGMAGAALASLPQAGYRPALDTPAARFGVAYVIEGAQLGGRVLGRTLAPALGDWTPRWLQGYGEEQARYWQAFIRCAESALVTQEARREAAAAAAQAFSSLAAWFAQRQRMRAGNEVRRVPDAA